MKTAIIKCTCSHDFQDTRYGNKMRVHNPTMKKSGVKVVYRCTVCAKENNY